MKSKKYFKRKGLTNNPAMNKMIDTISDRLTNFDASEGNLIQSMISMAQSVADEMKPDLENNPDAFQNTLGSITEIFQDMMSTSEGPGNIPSELKDILNIVKSMTGTDGNNLQSDGSDIMATLETIIEANGLDREAFFNAIKTDTGEIDLNKLESCLSKI